MTAIRHNDAVLDAAYQCVLAYGVRRTTLTDVARRAGVSRMTVYRHWPDMRALVADLMTREWVRVIGGLDLADPVRAVVAGVRELRGHPLWRKIVEADPELLLPYLLDRRGASQEAILAVLEPALGGPRKARAVLLAAQSFLLSAPTMLGPVTLDDLDAELATLLSAYLGSPAGSPPRHLRTHDPAAGPPVSPNPTAGSSASADSPPIRSAITQDAARPSPSPGNPAFTGSPGRDSRTEEPARDPARTGSAPRSSGRGAGR